MYVLELPPTAPAVGILASPAGDGIPQLLRLLPPPLLPSGERAQLCEPQQELHLQAHAAHAAGYGLPGAHLCRPTAARAVL
eukprot:1158821-Pelagomonas_calceolata.AAC.3